jgi:integrase
VATRKAMQDRVAVAKDDAERLRWRQAEPVLVLAEATGRRLPSAIRQLRWEDISCERKTIRWAAASDKRRKEWIMPATDSLLSELKEFQKALLAVGGWIIADASKDPPVAVDRHRLAGLLETAEGDANSRSWMGRCGTRIGARGRRNGSICRRPTSPQQVDGRIPPPSPPATRRQQTTHSSP